MGEQIKNTSYVDDSKSMVCQNVSEYHMKATLAQKIEEVPILILVKEPSLTKFYANSLILTPVKEYDAKAESTNLKNVEMKPGVEKYEMLLDNRINYR